MRIIKIKKNVLNGDEKMKKKFFNVKNNEIIKKLGVSVVVLIAILIATYFLFRRLGITTLTREQIQTYVQNSGAFAPLAFILISFLQVTFIPVPGMITILAGCYVFGAWQALLYSYIGMFLGSIVAFALGRIIGKPYINWVAGGKQKANEWFKKLNGREKVFLFFAFLLPYFPDDLLCSVAGALPIKWRTFIIMQLITRFTSIGATLLFMSGEVIPYRGWGIVAVIFISIVAISIFVLSIIYAERINDFFDGIINKFNSKNKNK